MGTYKNLVERLSKETYWSGSSGPGSRDIHPAICDEAADAIAELMARAESAEREMDAAIKDLRSEVIGTIHACDYCKKNDPENFQCKHTELTGCCEWEWNGK